VGAPTSRALDVEHDLDAPFEVVRDLESVVGRRLDAGAYLMPLRIRRLAPALRQVYDVSHNMAKIEEHTVNDKRVTLCVHRKGATRSFPPGHPDIPERYRSIGQPVLIPGDMGRYSFLAVGAPQAMESSFGSTCHGAGRAESRTRAKKLLKGRDIRQELEDKGIIAMAHGWASLAEEASLAYKDVEDVVRVADSAGLSRKVARLRPLGVIKG